MERASRIREAKFHALINENVLRIGEIQFKKSGNTTTDKEIADFCAGAFEGETLNRIRVYHQRDKLSLDIGANIGLYATYLAALCPQGPKVSVICFEPNISAYRYLTDHIETNGLSNVVALNLACGSNNEESQLFLNSEDNTSVFASETRLLDSAALKMRKVRLDDFLLANPSPVESGFPSATVSTGCLLDTNSYKNGPIGFIKVDVEGFENEVFAGACQLLRRDSPDLCFEINLTNWAFRDLSLRSVFDLLQSMDYSVYFESEAGGIKKIESLRFSARVFNVHAFHQSRVKYVESLFQAKVRA